MAKTYLLERQQFVPRPLAEVFAFFADAGNLETLTPANLNFEISTPRPIEMQAGTVIDYQLKLAGVPFKWKTLIESFDPPQRFTDVQSRGPYKLWHHTHEFTAVDGGTLVVDRVRYQLPLGPLGRVAHAAFVRRQLKNIFDFRANKLAELFPAQPSPV
jgi:ligand-binding SRPBCC domain-containing protein